MKKKIYILLSFLIVISLIVIFTKLLNQNKFTTIKEGSKRILTSIDKPILKIKFANFWKDAKPFDLGLELISEVLSEKYNLEVIKKGDTNCDIVIEGIIFKKGEGVDSVNYGNAIKIFYTWEAEKPNVDLYDLALGFNFIDHPNYIRLPLYYNAYRQKVSENYDRGKCNLSKKNFACFLVTNGGEAAPEKFDGCIARNRMFHHLSLYKKVLSGGPYLNNIKRTIPASETMTWLNECKFTIAYENETFDGYMTEKVFQAYYGGTIPIYYGHPNTLGDINKKAIIYAGDFATENDLVEYVKKVDQDDKLYCDIWNERLIIDKNKNYEVIKAQVRDKLNQILAAKLKLKN